MVKVIKEDLYMVLDDLFSKCKTGKDFDFVTSKIIEVIADIKEDRNYYGKDNKS